MLWDPLNIWPEARRWIWATLAFWICLIQGPSFVENLWESRDVLPDFFQEWASARNRFEGLEIYTTHSVTIPRYLGSLGETVHPLVQLNAHPPTSVLLALPFGRLDFHTSFFVWNLISLPPLGFSLWLVARELKIQVSAWSIFPFLALLLTCGPLWQEIHMGQLNLFLLPMITGAWAAERSGRPKLAGVLLAAATSVKLFPAFLIVYYAYRRRWQLVAASIVALAALTGLTASVLGLKCYRDYFLNVVPEVHWFRVGWHNASFTGFWSRLFDLRRNDS